MFIYPVLLYLKEVDMTFFCTSFLLHCCYEECVQFFHYFLEFTVFLLQICFIRASDCLFPCVFHHLQICVNYMFMDPKLCYLPKALTVSSMFGQEESINPFLFVTIQIIGSIHYTKRDT